MSRRCSVSCSKSSASPIVQADSRRCSVVATAFRKSIGSSQNSLHGLWMTLSSQVQPRVVLHSFSLLRELDCPGTYAPQVHALLARDVLICMLVGLALDITGLRCVFDCLQRLGADGGLYLFTVLDPLMVALPFLEGARNKVSHIHRAIMIACHAFACHEN